MIRRDTALRWFGATRAGLGKVRKNAFPRTLGFDDLRRMAGILGESIPFSAITVGIEKGGVGKTAMVINLAAFLAARGLRVLVVDFDAQACATNFFLPEDTDYSRLVTLLELFNVEGLTFASSAVPTTVEGVRIIPSKPKVRTIGLSRSGPDIHTMLKKQLDSARTEFDCVIFDVPPSFSDRVAAAYMAADLVIIPAVPDIWSIESITLTIEDIGDIARAWSVPEPAVRLVLNRYSAHRKAGVEGGRIIGQEFGDIMLSPAIADSSSIQNALNDGMTLLNTGYGTIRENYAALTRNICMHLKGELS